eukprot:SAG11_NODE_2624_length_3163_cov_3.247228_6_plen_48_part_00
MLHRPEALHGRMRFLGVSMRTHSTEESHTHRILVSMMYRPEALHGRM